MNLVQTGVKEEKLPGFKKFMEEGAWGELKSTLPTLSPPAWTSIFTGVNPGKHGIYNFVKHRPGSKALTPVSSKDVMVEYLWRILSRSGKRCVLMNIPFVYPLKPVNGILIAGLGAPSKDSEFTFPSQWRQLILRLFPEYDVDFNEDLILNEGFQKHLSRINKISKANIELYKYLLQNERWDFFAAVFRTLDVVQHYVRAKDTLLRYYQMFDQVLEYTMDNVKDAYLIVCSDHGFRDVHTDVFVNNWLEGLGLLKIRSRPLARLGITAEKFQIVLTKLGFKRLVWSLKRGWMLEKLLRIVPSNKLGFYANVDWKKVKAYYFGNAGGMILLNKENLDVNAGEDKAIVQRIVKEATTLVDPQNEMRVVKGAYLKHEVFTGDLKGAPDVTLTEAEGYRFVGGYNVERSIFKNMPERGGDHDLIGILYFKGPGIGEDFRLNSTSVLDVTPTILHLMGLNVPEYVDGRPLQLDMARV